MLIKVNNEYLQFKADILIDRHFLLLDDIDSIGDLSYSFEIPNTKTNRDILGIVDRTQSTKSFLTDLQAEIQTDGGIGIYRGLLRLERVSKKNISCSFFSGNSNWLAEIDGKCLDLNLDLVGVVEVEKTEANIQATWNDPEGLVFPILDAGLLRDRIAKATRIRMYAEDFQQAIYAKTVMRCIFVQAGIKLEGELFQEHLYNNLVFTSNNVNGTQDLLNQRSVRVSKTSSQSISTVATQVTFTDDTTFPNHNGGHYNTSTSEWTADKPMRITGTVYLSLSASTSGYIFIYKNGVGSSAYFQTGSEMSISIGGTIDPLTNRPANYLDVEAGDVITVRFRTFSGSIDVTGGYLEIIPTQFNSVVANTILGGLSKTEYVSGIFKMFGVIPKYNTETKTLTCNLLKKLKTHTPVEIKGIIIDENYTELLTNYGKRTVFKYGDADIESVEKYNELNETPYGAGVLEIDNSYIEEEVEIELPWSVGYNYFNDPLSANLVNCQFRDFENDGEEITISSVANVAGNARFTTSAAHGLAVDDWVRISTDTGEYAGNGKVSAVPASTTFEIYELTYVDAIASGTVIKLNVVENSSETIYALVNIDTCTIGEVTTRSVAVELNSSAYATVAFTYNNFPYSTAIAISAIHRNTIFFDNTNIPGYMQFGLLENYYQVLKDILNDPDVLLVEANIDEADFLNLSSQSPIKFYSDSDYGLYYLNKISGYQGSHLPCEVELIKL